MTLKRISLIATILLDIKALLKDRTGEYEVCIGRDGFNAKLGRQGEIRDRTTEGQHYRIAGLNLLTAVIIYWNTVHLGHAVTERRNEGLDVPPEFLPHISPLGWAHILLTGEYLWPKEPKA